MRLAPAPVLSLPAMSADAARLPDEAAVLAVTPLGFPWETADPFLFCVHHDDAYPRGNDRMGPDASLAGRSIGQDFEGPDGWRMYHGDVVPGFPRHPHRGFETVTIVRRGFIDHADSLGATARFGSGDVQWLTAGRGIVHSEMFPLRDRARPNPLELFQIWLNLPAADKFAAPHFTMLWRELVPSITSRDAAGRSTEITVVAGALAGNVAPAPPPDSWASRRDSDVAIWTIRMAPQARFALPRSDARVNRSVYFFRGTEVRVAQRRLDAPARVILNAAADVELEAGPDGAQMLLLHGRPIAEPVVQYGPFVMNTRAEIEQAMHDYRHTQFGGWPWPDDGPVHARERGRFAKHADGKVEDADNVDSQAGAT